MHNKIGVPVVLYKDKENSGLSDFFLLKSKK